MQARTSILLLMTCLSLNACGPKNYLNDNDALRRENLELRKQVEALEKQSALRAGQLATLEADLQRQRAGEPTAQADAPVLSGVQLDRYSGPLDMDGDGFDEVLRLYVYPTDQQGRFLSTAGSVTVRVAHVPPSGEPTVLAEKTLDAEAFDGSYRAGFTGPYYRVDLPLPAAMPREVVVRITLTEARSGVSFSDQQTYRVQSADGSMR